MTQVLQALRSAINGQTIAQTHAEAIDFGDAVHYARTVGLPNLLKLDFQERALRLKALAKYLGEHKELLYAVSAHTGATRADSWVDIEGGAGTLFAYSSIGSNELPSGNLIHEGPALRAHTYWCHGGALRCTSTLSTSRFGDCSKSLPPAFWRACPALANQPAPPVT